MARVVVELKDSPGSEPMRRLLAALACLGPDDEIELISAHDPRAFHAVLEEEGCACERLRGEEGRYILLIRRRP